MTLPISQNAGLYVRYEKAGMILDALPIPWNADAVIVEANVRLPAKAPREKPDFKLRIADEGTPVTAELIAQQGKQVPLRVFFRIPPPAATSTAAIHWREHLLPRLCSDCPRPQG